VLTEEAAFAAVVSGQAPRRPPFVGHFWRRFHTPGRFVRTDLARASARSAVWPTPLLGDLCEQIKIRPGIMGALCLGGRGVVDSPELSRVADVSPDRGWLRPVKQ
jgi:hypothetical protein